MLDLSKYKRVIEAYRVGQDMLEVVVEFGATDVRRYRIYAAKNLSQPDEYCALLDRRRVMEQGGKKVLVWAKFILPGVSEGRTSEEALVHGLSALDRLASGGQDSEGPD